MAAVRNEGTGVRAQGTYSCVSVRLPTLDGERGQRLCHTTPGARDTRGNVGWLTLVTNLQDGSQRAPPLGNLTSVSLHPTPSQGWSV